MKYFQSRNNNFFHKREAFYAPLSWKAAYFEVLHKILLKPPSRQ